MPLGIGKFWTQQVNALELFSRNLIANHLNAKQKLKLNSVPFDTMTLL